MRISRHRSRTVLAWGLLFLAGMNVLLLLGIEHWRPELRDREYVHKRDLLRALLQAQPDRPLLLALGSSRVTNGFSPAVVRPLLALGRDDLLVFNFGMSGAGPITQQVMLSRLLAEGLRPRWLILEVFPAYLFNEGNMAEERRLLLRRFTRKDLAELRPYWRKPKYLYLDWGTGLLSPWHTYRLPLLRDFAPDWLPLDPMAGSGPMDKLGWAYDLPEDLDQDQRGYATVALRSIFDMSLRHFRVSDVSDRAMRQMLAVCRREGIEVLFVVMPEGSEFRDYYRPGAEADLDAYLARLSRECSVPVVDTRDWMADEGFADSIHLLPAAAADFTRRLGRDVLRPWLAGAPEQSGAVVRSPARKGGADVPALP
jgi:hypothetical protein